MPLSAAFRDRFCAGLAGLYQQRQLVLADECVDDLITAYGRSAGRGSGAQDLSFRPPTIAEYNLHSQVSGRGRGFVQLAVGADLLSFQGSKRSCPQGRLKG